tara:strand:- start:1675 stop:2286 length:612 start_codon:yes stop_codon:yes gene_type:complete
MNSQFPEGEISKVLGKCIVLKGDDIDTDRIIPARFLKCVSFNALGDQVFADDRIELKGQHPFDSKTNKDATILVVNDNFGCGSSREHAPQALMRWGVRAVLGQSFAEIFYGNCLALGIPCATTSAQKIKNIQYEIQKNQSKIWELNVRDKLFINDQKSWNINIEKGPLEMLTTGRWDATSQLIEQDAKIIETMRKLPYINNFK